MSAATFGMTSQSPAETHELGLRIGRALEAGTCVALIGPLGAGKTHLVKGIAVGAGVPIDTPVNSPTFVIVNEYAGRLRLYHIDVYRLGGAGEFVGLGVEEMLASDGAVLIEWADRVAEALPAERLTIEMSHAGATERRIEISGAGVGPMAVIGALNSSS